MARGAFRQADVQRIIRAAGKEGALLQVDIRSLVITVIPSEGRGAAESLTDMSGGILPPGALAPDGKENWDEN